MKNFSDFGIQIPYGRTTGQVKTVCPHCMRSRSHPNDKSLSVDLDRGIWNCHHCGWTGSLEQKENWERTDYRKSEIRHRQHKTYAKPKPRQPLPLSPKATKWFKEARGISEQTLRDMKITEGMEFMPQKGRECNTVQFNYFKNGELVNTKFRTGDKCFKFVKDCEILPYNIDNIKGQEECIITEGEMDTLSFWETGHHNCVSVPAGGGNTSLEWLDDYMDEYFDDKKAIYIASDTDAVGVHLRNELIRRFGPERCRVLDYGADCKDANEALVKHGRDFLEKCLRNAPDVKVDGVFTVKDFEQDLDSLFERGMQKGVTLGFPNFDNICSFETKRLCVITGIPGCLDENTFVNMSDGSVKRIADVEVGDNVLSLQADYSFCIGTVTDKWDSGSKACYKLTTRDGHVVLATDEHRFLTTGGWKRLKEIKEGDYVPFFVKKETSFEDKPCGPRQDIDMPTNGHHRIRVKHEKVDSCEKHQDNGMGLVAKTYSDCAWTEIVSIRKAGLRHTYDIEVADTHNFFAGGICTHNSGKSEFIDEMAERLNMRYGWRFAFFSPENAPLQYHAAKLIEKFTGKKFGANVENPLTSNEYKAAKEHLQDDFSFIAPSDYKLDTILEKARFLVRKRGIKCLVIDPYNRLEDEQGARSETRYISGILDKLQNFAQQEDILAVLMAHPTKMPKDKDGKTMVPTLYDISGSANFYNKADFGIIVNRDREAQVTEIKVEKVKFRHLGQCGSVFFKYNINNGRYTPVEEGQLTVNWDNSNHLTDIRRQREEAAQQGLDLGGYENAPFAPPSATDDVPF